MNTVAPADASLFDYVATVVREEPLDAVDPETRGLLASALVVGSPDLVVAVWNRHLHAGVIAENLAVAPANP